MNNKRGLVVFDLDGTLLRGQTVCEILAKPLGRDKEMNQFEALSHEMDIIQARKTMATWYQGHSTAALQAHLPTAQWAPNAMTAISRLQAHGIEVAIASITWKFAVGWFASQLGIQQYLGTDLSPSGEITHVWGRDKAVWMTELVSKYHVPKRHIAAVGDSGGDVEMLRLAALRFFVGAIPPTDISNVLHMPNADIKFIADYILEAWEAR